MKCLRVLVHALRPVLCCYINELKIYRSFEDSHHKTTALIHAVVRGRGTSSEIPAAMSAAPAARSQ